MSIGRSSGGIDKFLEGLGCLTRKEFDVSALSGVKVSSKLINLMAPLTSKSEILLSMRL